MKKAGTIKKVGSISKVGGLGTTKKMKHPVLQSKLHTDTADKKSHIRKSSETKPMTLAEQARQTQHMMRFYKDGLTIATANKHSDKARVERARKELKIYFVKSKNEEVFKFIVKSSGKHNILNSSIKAEKYQVDVMWKDVDKMIAEGKDTVHILKYSRIRTQCSCPDCTFYGRFWLTKAKAVLGLQELRYPTIKNPNGDGFLCKHQILLFSKLTNKAFLGIFQRYIDNTRAGKKTRIKEKDRVSTHLSSGRSKPS